MNAFKRLQLEYDGIYGIIHKYTSDPYIINYLNKLKAAIDAPDYDALMYSLSAIDKWYDDNIYAISHNEFVFNFDSHQKNMQLIKEILSEISEQDFIAGSQKMEERTEDPPGRLLCFMDNLELSVKLL